MSKPYVKAQFPTAACLLVLFSGCAGYRSLELKPVETQHAFESRTLTDPRVLDRVNTLVPADRDSLRWSTAELLIAANEYNPALAETRMRLNETAAGLTTARAIPNPSVSLGSEYDLKQVGEPSWLYSISMSFLIDTAAARKIRMHIAQANVRGARLDYAESLWSVRRDLRASLVSILIQERRVALLRVAEEANDELAKSITARVREGEAASSERLRAQLELTRSQAALADAKQKLNDGKSKLAATVGIPIAALEGQPLTMPRLDDPEEVAESRIETLRARAALARTDLERAIVEYDSRELELREQVRMQYPQVSLGPGYAWDHGIPKATFGISFTAPIFNRNQGPIAAAQARRTSAAQHVMTVQQRALNEIDSAHIAYREQIEALTLARAQSREAQDAVRQLERAVTVGTEDRPTLLAARIAANADALAELDALERTHIALGQLEDALRTPLDDRESALQLPAVASVR
jgi:outer membrane protein TolC